ERGGGSSEGVLEVERDGGPEDRVVAGGEGGDAIGPWPSRPVVEPLRGTAEVLGGGGVRGAHRHADGLLLRGLAAAVDGPAVEELAAGARGRRERDADAVVVDARERRRPITLPLVVGRRDLDRDVRHAVRAH